MPDPCLCDLFLLLKSCTLSVKQSLIIKDPACTKPRVNNCVHPASGGSSVCMRVLQ